MRERNTLDTECAQPGGMEAAEVQGALHVQAEEQEHVEEEDAVFERDTVDVDVNRKGDAST